MADKLTRADVVAKGHELKRWGKWGPDDEYGATNFIEPEDIVAAAKLIRKGKVFALGLPLDGDGPQRGLFGGRWNPIHTMLATGTDALAGNQDQLPNNLRYADEDGVYEFFLCAPPLNITKGTGSPINPNAIK